MTSLRPTNASLVPAMKLSIYMVFEAASLGLALKIKKCSYFPRFAMVALGTVVDLKEFQFRVFTKRARKITAAIHDLESAIARNHNAVPAKMVASFIGLLWSISSCQSAASVMTRDIIAVLSQEMRYRLRVPHRSLEHILRAFWSGSVQWSHGAHRQLLFWKSVDFLALRSPISADVLGKSIELTFTYPAYISDREMSIMCQDASVSASGGGQLRRHQHELLPPRRSFLYMFSPTERKFSSTLREILGVLRCLMATEKSTKSRIIFAFFDNMQSVQAIKFGSRIPEIQEVACDIFMWCLKNGKVCWPVWLPRTHAVIKDSDCRSRMTIPFDQRSPTPVVQRADSMAANPAMGPTPVV